MILIWQKEMTNLIEARTEEDTRGYKTKGRNRLV